MARTEVAAQKCFLSLSMLVVLLLLLPRESGALAGQPRAPRAHMLDHHSELFPTVTPTKSSQPSEPTHSRVSAETETKELQSIADGVPYPSPSTVATPPTVLETPSSEYPTLRQVSFPTGKPSAVPSVYPVALPLTWDPFRSKSGAPSFIPIESSSPGWEPSGSPSFAPSVVESVFETTPTEFLSLHPSLTSTPPMEPVGEQSEFVPSDNPPSWPSLMSSDQPSESSRLWMPCLDFLKPPL